VSVLFVTTASAQDPQWEKILCFEESACKWCHALAYEELRESAMGMKRSVLNLIVSLSVYKMFLIKKSVCVN